MRIEKESLISKKARISYLEILLMIVSIFAFSYILYEGSKEIEIVDAQTSYNYSESLTEEVVHEESSDYRCCPETNEGAICQEFVYLNCEDKCKGNCLPAKCENIASCKPGCCFDEQEGLCSPNSPKQKCEQEGGKWSNKATCNIEECKLGCCVLGQNVDFVTEKRCERLSALQGLQLDFRSELVTELECLVLGNSQAVGACIIEEDDEKSCKFNSKVDCLKLGGDFYENVLCTAPELNTTCKKTSNTKCIEGKDEVYFVDSCGNIGNIYDSNKVNDANYWKNYIGKNSSCNSNSGNVNSKTCGNCDYFLGSKCGKGDASYGDYICKDLNCKDAPAMVDAFGKILQSKDRKQGEAWCVYDAYIGEGKDVVGSRHFKYYCLDGEVEIEPCSDYRQEICVESETEGERGSFSQAACRVNRWRECLDYNNLAEKRGDKINYEKMKGKCEKNSDCYIKNLNFGEGYNFWQCLPNYPTGLELKTERGGALGSDLCSMADFECVKVEVKELAGMKCVAGCECDTAKFTQQMNDWCVSLGDCGAYVNIAGKVTDDGYSVDKAPEIDLKQYLKYLNPKEGKKAEPGDLKEMIGMISGMSAEDVVVDEKSLFAILAIQLGKGAMGGAIAASGLPQGIYQALFPLKGTAGFEAGFQGTFMSKGAFIEGFTNAAAGAIGGTIAGYLVAKMFGLKGDAVFLVSCGSGTVGAIAAGLASMTAGATTGIAGAVQSIVTLGGTLTPAALGGGVMGPIFSSLAIGFIWGLIAAIVLSMIAKAMGLGEVTETKVHFTCQPWQAPVGGSDCGKCNVENGLKICSNYRCSSLGQACELLNEGTGNEECIWQNKNDASAPEIIPWIEILTKGYKYDEVKADGFKIKQENGECVPVYTPLIFGIKTENELSQCKFDIENKNYEEMKDYFGFSNLYQKQHLMPFTMPSPEAIARQYNVSYQYVLDKIGEMKFYIKCQDANGNTNTAPYVIDICIKPGQDKTAPVINTANPVSGSYVKFNASSQDVTLHINEPAECKWDFIDRDYDVMEKNMSCLTGFTQGSLYGWPCQTILPIQNSTIFNFRCKDQPWLKGTANETDRNENKQSYVYTLKKSASELKIIEIEPKGEIMEGVEPASVSLKITTSGGAENGKASCSFRFSQDTSWIQFLNTFSSKHEQRFDYLLRGTHKIYVRCEDIAGNSAAGETTFNLKIDTSSPRVTRIYGYGGLLHLFTDEEAECVYDFKSCNFVWVNATKMDSSDFIEHKTTWNIGSKYYIKCKDKYGHQPDQCSIIVKAY